MMIQLYKTKPFLELVESNRLYNIKDNLTKEDIEVIEYTFNRYENINDIFIRLQNIDISPIDTMNDDYKVMVIQYKEKDDKDTQYKYIWEYYTNWIKLRD